MQVQRRTIGKASFHPREVYWVIFLLLILRIDGLSTFPEDWGLQSQSPMEILRMPNALGTSWVTLEVNDVPLSLCNDLGRPDLIMISWSRFFLPPPQPSQSRWESLQSILWMYPSWLIGIYTLEKLASGWSPSASPFRGRSQVVGWTGPAGVLELLGSWLTPYMSPLI